MNTFARLTLFGAISGIVWGLAPLTLSELGKNSASETASVLFAGAITGVAVTLLLARPLRHAGRRSAVALGVLSLPVGAFSFGVIASWVHFGLASWLGVTYRFVQYRFAPLEVGMDYAIFATRSWFAIALIPLGIATTLLLHRAVHGVDDFDWI